MTRNLKALGLTLVAVFALGAMMASAASAHEFKSDKTNTVLTGHNTGEGDHVFTTNTGAAVVCKKATFQGAQLGATEVDTVTVVPKYSECTFAGNPATVEVTDCAYIFDSDTDANKHADVDIECAEGGQIEIITSACTLDIRAQTKIEGGVHYFNETADSTVTVEATATNIIVAQKTGPPLLCAFAGLTGTYKGNATISGTEHLGNSGTTTTPVYTEGNKAKISVVGADSKP